MTTDAASARAEGHARRDAGDLTAAVEAFEASADSYRRGSKSDANLDGLVEVLCDCAETLTVLGNAVAAATRATEAVDLLRDRAMLGDGASANPQAARALLTLGAAGLRSGAESATDDIDAAVHMSRRVASALPTEENRARLATALNYQGMTARTMGRLDDAAGAAAETVAIRRELAADDARRFSEPLASALNTLAAVQAISGHLAAAASSVTEACSILRDVVAGGKVSALPNLAATESNAAAFLGDVPDLDRAIEYGVSAIEHYEQLTASNPPPAFVPECARALVVLATCVAGDDRFDAATDLCHSATAMLVENASMLGKPDIAFIGDALQHYQAFVQLSGADVDRELVQAAVAAVSQGFTT